MQIQKCVHNKEKNDRRDSFHFPHSGGRCLPSLWDSFSSESRVTDWNVQIMPLSFRSCYVSMSCLRFLRLPSKNLNYHILFLSLFFRHKTLCKIWSFLQGYRMIPLVFIWAWRRQKCIFIELEVIRHWLAHDILFPPVSFAEEYTTSWRPMKCYCNTV